MRGSCGREQHNRNGETPDWEIRAKFPQGTHPWGNANSELPPSSISSDALRGCPLFTAVEVRVGVAGMLFGCRLSSWDTETSSLCRLEGPASSRGTCLLETRYHQTLQFFKTCSGFVKKLNKVAMENLDSLITT